MKFNNLILSCAIALSGATGPLLAAEDEGRDFDDDRRGTINAINLNKRTVVIDDWVYNLALALRVQEGGKPATDFALRQHVNVEFDIDPKTTDEAVQMITDIRILGTDR